MELYWIDHLLFALFGILFPINSMLSTQPKLAQVESWESEMKRMLYLSNTISLFLMALIVMLCWWLWGRPLQFLGLQLPITGSWSIGLSLSAIFLTLYILDIYLEIRTPSARRKSHAHWQKHTPFLPENQQENAQFVPLAFSAGINEEIVFRGFFIQYFLTLFWYFDHAELYAIIIPSVVFALVHYYQGWKAVLKIGLLSLFFGLIFLKTESLLFPIILHILIDLVGGWLSWKYLSKIPD